MDIDLSVESKMYSISKNRHIVMVFFDLDMITFLFIIIIDKILLVN